MTHSIRLNLRSFTPMKHAAFAFLFFLCFAAQSQTTIQGIVLDTEEQPIGFAHIYNQTLDVGKVSDMTGRFQLMAFKGDTLKISYVGYETLYLRLDNIHLVNYLKIVLPKDSVLLPSITVYADKDYRIPLNIKGEPIFIPGVSIVNPDPQPYMPGGFSSGFSGVGGVPVPGFTIDGPISYFTKEYQEKRKAVEVYQETAKTITYQKYIAQDSIRQKLCRIYDLDSAQYAKVIIRLNETFPGIQAEKRPQEIWLWIITHFDRTVPIIKESRY